MRWATRAAVVLWASVAWAQELPERTFEIVSLTPDQARSLVTRESGSGRLYLPGLTALDAETAKALAEFDGRSLHLDGLTALDVDTAKVLAGMKGQLLYLNGLATLDTDTAEALAEFTGEGLGIACPAGLDADIAKTLAGFKGSQLYLGKLATLDADTAQVLAEFKGWYLHLGLTAIDAATAKALSKFRCRIGLQDLQRASFGAVAVLRQNPRIEMPDHWLLLRYDIAALVGTVLFLALAGFAVWYNRRPRDAD